MLRLTDLAVGYGHKPVLAGVNLSVPRGSIYGLIGVNGSGKSTLLKTLLGLLPPLKGHITIEGAPSSGGPGTRIISLLESQSHVAFPMTVGELLEIALRRGGAPELFVQSLEAVELTGFENRNLLEMSSGETRRAFIAHTLCSASPIVMIDEPFSHLDWSHQKNLVESLKRWRKLHGTTFVLAIHELEWVVQIADRVCALGEGKVLADGNPREVFSSSGVREVFAFQSSIDENPIDGSARLTLGRPKS